MARSSISHFDPWCSNLDGNQSVHSGDWVVIHSRAQACPLTAELQQWDVHMKSCPPRVGVAATELTFTCHSTACSGCSWAVTTLGATSWYRVRDLDLKLQEGKGGPLKMPAFAGVSVRGVSGNPIRNRMEGGRRGTRQEDQLGASCDSSGGGSMRPVKGCGKLNRCKGSKPWRGKKSMKTRSEGRQQWWQSTSTLSVRDALPVARVLCWAPCSALHRHHLLGSSNHQEGRCWSYPHFTKVKWFVSGHKARENQ